MTSTIDRLDAMGHGVPAYGTREGLGDRAWLDARREHLGASEVASVLGLSSYRTAREVWERKRGLAEPTPDTFSTLMGRAAEPALLDWYVREIGVGLIAPVPTLAHPEHPWLTATCDGLALEDRSGANVAGPVCIEAKASARGTSQQWRQWRDTGQPPEGSSLVGYWIQVQTQMAVTGHRIAHLYVSLEMAAPMLIPVLAAPEWFASVLPVLEAWWHRHVVEGEEPPTVLAEVQDSEPPTLGFPVPVPDLICRDPEAAEPLERVAELQARIKADTAEAKALKATLRQRMGDASVLVGGARTMKVTRSTRTTLDTKRLKAELPDVAAEYQRTTDTERVTFGEVGA